MKNRANKLRGKIVTFMGMAVSAFFFCFTFFAAWLDFDLPAIAINLGSAAALFPCLSFQLRSAGHWEGHEGLHLTWLDRIPLDVYLAAGFFIFILGAEAWDSETQFLCNVTEAAMALLLIPSLAARYKTGTLWRNTLLYRLARLLRRGIRRFIRSAAELVRAIPLLWSSLAVLLALSAVDLLFLAWDSRMTTISLWVVVRGMVLLVLLWLLLDIRKLLKIGEQLAHGDFSQQVQIASPLPALQKHAEHLNSIQSGLQKAVDERMKSERMKTELITNVSHDIKTPLTSIVNYVDLLGKTDVTDPTALQYIAVLERQAQRLRKLTEDLVEASKAATGNIAVHLAPVDLQVLLSQVCGEYQQRLQEKDLQAVFVPGEEPLRIMADGQLLWRVLDNLMGNVYKYAMPGTRVYLTVTSHDKRAHLSIKNISLYPITVSGQELTERFVRGDSARSSEGSGLGLSIAASLTELQQGTFAIHVDGDLFKAQMTFPLCEESGE